MPQFPYLVSDLLYDIVETVNCKFSRILSIPEFCPPLVWYCRFDQSKRIGLFVPFATLETHPNEKLASLLLSARRALSSRPIRL